MPWEPWRPSGLSPSSLGLAYEGGFPSLARCPHPRGYLGDHVPLNAHFPFVRQRPEPWTLSRCVAGNHEEPWAAGARGRGASAGGVRGSLCLRQGSSPQGEGGRAWGWGPEQVQGGSPAGNGEATECCEGLADKTEKHPGRRFRSRDPKGPSPTPVLNSRLNWGELPPNRPASALPAS